MYEIRIGFFEGLTQSVVMDCFNRLGKKFVFQLEEGTKNGYKHYQSRLSLFAKKRKHLAEKLLLSVFKKAGWDITTKGYYIKPTTNTEFLKGTFIYQMKEDTRIDGPWSDKDIPSYVPRHIRNRTPRKFQQVVLDSQNIYDERTINCIVDEEGNKGKSILAAFIRNAGGITIPCIGDTERLIATCCDILMAKDNRQPGLIAIDLPRSINNNRLSQLFQAIEIIKDGWVYDMRNHYKEWVYDKPAIWVFTNNQMPTKYASADRWKFWTITEDYALKEKKE